MSNDRRNRIAQWAFDTRAILGRFHLWLEDVELQGITNSTTEGISFVEGSLERAFVMATAVTALGTRLFGRWGEGADLDKAGINRVKKDADAVSAYAMSEALWYLTRSLPENHAVMISLGEGLMPKAGETPEMGSNPLLGFGRVYARPQVARFLDRRVHRLVNDPSYEWPNFWLDLQTAGITVWGAAVDTLENTSRFAKGSPSGPMTVLHLFNQPLKVARPYEGYMGNLALPQAVVSRAAEKSILIDFKTPRAKVMEAIRDTYPNLAPENVHVWTLGGPSRVNRLSALWAEWEAVGAHLVEDGWILPQTSQPVFTESGTYAPTFRIGPYADDEGRTHLFICDGYAASAEAMQAASLDPILDLSTSMCLFSSQFKASIGREQHIITLDPDSDDFEAELAATLEAEIEPDFVDAYRASLQSAREALMPVDQRTLTADDFFPLKEWRVLALAGYLLPDPYSGSEGVKQVAEDTFRVTTRAATRLGLVDATVELRLMEPFEEMRMVFSPLLDRFYSGQDYRRRAVKISDSGRIRNELQTLCSEAIEYLPGDSMLVRFSQIDESVMPSDKRELIREVLKWYKANHPIWFTWLEMD
ncbi:MAG: hypothetical protein LJE93_03250 [Acidobacteria bacterium]|jgi:hypothetical protein|nr:hypothetical protein [Acidobacteriota bacterium]